MSEAATSATDREYVLCTQAGSQVRVTSRVRPSHGSPTSATVVGGGGAVVVVVVVGGSVVVVVDVDVVVVLVVVVDVVVVEVVVLLVVVVEGTVVVVVDGGSVTTTSSGRFLPLWRETKSTPSFESGPRWKDTGPGPVTPAVTSNDAHVPFYSLPESAMTPSAAGRLFQVIPRSSQRLPVARTFGPSPVESSTRSRSVAFVMTPDSGGTVNRRYDSVTGARSAVSRDEEPKFLVGLASSTRASASAANRVSTAPAGSPSTSGPSPIA